jgi:hypothetical protein
VMLAGMTSLSERCRHPQDLTARKLPDHSRLPLEPRRILGFG